MRISTLCSLIIYSLLFSNVDCIKAPNHGVRRLLSGSPQNSLKTNRFLKIGLSFVSSPHSEGPNLQHGHLNLGKNVKSIEVRSSYQDSTENPAKTHTKLALLSTNARDNDLVNCSGSEPPEESLAIPYDRIHTCAFDGHEALFEILETLKPQLHQKSAQKFFENKSQHTDISSASFDANAFRSIRSLTYWVGSRILNTAKKARDNFDSQGISTPEDCISERVECERAIRKFLSDNLDHWRPTRLLEPSSENTQYPTFTPDNPEEYVRAVWSFNHRVFRSELPESWEVDFGWFDILDENYRNKLVKSGEVFTFEELDRMDLPKIMFPNELKGMPSSLGNCVFRSMAKLFCDIHSPFSDVDYAKVLTDAFRFVESNSAKEAGVNFTVIQRGYDSMVNYDSDMISAFNARDIMAKEYDLNARDALILDTAHLPYLKNSFHPLSLYNGDEKPNLELYENSFKTMPEHPSRSTWFHDGKLVVPVAHITRSLINNSLDEFSNVVALVVNDLLQLKPLQLNFVQNRIVSTCVKFANALRSLEAYEINYQLGRNTTTNNKTVQSLNLTPVQSVLFTMNLHEKCVANNSLYPLSNDFIRTSQIEGIVDVDELSEFKDGNVYDSNVYKRFLGQKQQDPVKFISEYLDPSVAPDDEHALRFLLNYYNFNLFAGRLPIDIKVKFKHLDYASSNDVSNALSTPTIYVNPLFQKNKRLISRSILDQCINIFLKWANKFQHEPAKEPKSLDDIVEYNLDTRIKNHILNCAEQSLSWPFYLDIFYVANGDIAAGRSMSKLFRDSFETEDVVTLLDHSVKREPVTDLWNKGKLPIRDFLASLFSGVYDLSYGILANPASIKVTSKLSLSELNYIENKFKHVCQTYYSLLNPEHNKLNSVLYLEALSIVEAAFNELREQCIKNKLIYTKDLVEAIAGVSKILTNSVQVHHDDSTMNLDKKTHTCSESEATQDLHMDDVNLFDYPQKLTTECSKNLALLLFDKYNKYLFHGFLPQVEIRFEDSDELSELRVDLTDLSRPTIVINSLIDDINLLNSQLIIQMIFLAHYHFRHVIADDFLNQFGLEFRSAFGVVHNTRMDLLKSKLIPVNLERKINSTKGMKDHNKQYVDFINRTLDYKDSNLVNLQASDFIYEVLDGRKRFRHDDKLSNPYESLQTLKAFAQHYFNSVSNRPNYAKSMIEASRSESSEGSETTFQSTQDSFPPTSGVSESHPAQENDTNLSDILSVFSPGMMKNEWIRNMVDHVELRLRDKKIGLFLQAANADWQSMLDENQQSKVIDYVARNTNDSLFNTLTKSGAMSKREAIDLIVHCIYSDPKFKHQAVTEKFNQSINPDRGPVAPPGVEVIKDSDSPETAPTPPGSLEDHFEHEMATVLGRIPPEDQETFVHFFHKLLERDFATCRNLLNSCSSPSSLVDRSMDVLASISSHSLIDGSIYEDIRRFLHR